MVKSAQCLKPIDIFDEMVRSLPLPLFRRVILYSCILESGGDCAQVHSNFADISQTAHLVSLLHENL